MYGVFGREATSYTVTYGVCTRFWRILLISEQPNGHSVLVAVQPHRYSITAAINIWSKYGVCTRFWWTLLISAAILLTPQRAAHLAATTQFLSSCPKWALKKRKQQQLPAWLDRLVIYVKCMIALRGTHIGRYEASQNKAHTHTLFLSPQV